MSRIARIVVPGVPYHITQRGNGRQQVFSDPSDHRLYLDLVHTHAPAKGLRVWAYCLMPNHVHLIAVPERVESMPATLRRVHAIYAQHFNLKYRSCGHVWQARYFSCPLEGAHLWRAIAYVERNPVRAGLAQRADAFPWSSAPARLGRTTSSDLLDLSEWRREYTNDQWTEALATSVDDEGFGRRVREASRSGKPLGNDAFIEALEKQSLRCLRSRAPGRPKKPQTNAGAQLAMEIGNCVYCPGFYAPAAESCGCPANR